MKIFSAEKDYIAEANTIAGTLYLKELIPNKKSSDAWINIGGWQSWNPCYEVEPSVKQETIKARFVKPFNCYLKFPETKYKSSKKIVLAQFITYFRWDNTYLFVISLNNLESCLPPVQFIIDRKTDEIKIELADKGKAWCKGDLQAKIEFFTAESYFEARDKLEKLFGSSSKESPYYSNRFDQISFLGETSLGWESWYNHYANIDQQLIEEDLEALSNTQNFLTITNKSTAPVFQIDDGWEKHCGEWEIDEKKFPKGLKFLTDKISAAGYIPGLWIAPFITDLRSPIAVEHPDWLLRDVYGHLVPAGFNFLWGVNWTFYALDLSNNDVLDYLDKTIDKIINQWGFRYIKLDFLYAGTLFGHYKTAGASYEWYNRVIKRLTARKTNNQGLPVAYLGCGAPLELSFNDLPLSRIGCDTYENWDNTMGKITGFSGRNCAWLNLQDTLGHAITDKILFANDPDVIFIRNKNCKLTRDEKILIATVNILFGSQLMYSDDPAESNSEEERQLAAEIDSIRKKYADEKFSVKAIEYRKYIIESQSGKYIGEILLDKKDHKINIREIIR